MTKIKSRKGEFFLIDGLFSIVILVIGFLIISSNQPKQTNELPLSIVSENTMSLLSSVKIEEMCQGFNCSNRLLSNYVYNNYTMNNNQSLLDSLGEMYYRNYKNRARELFRNITLEKDLIREELYGVELRINQEQIYINGKNQNKTKEMVSAKKIIFGFFENRNTGQVRYWGPYLAEVNIWLE